MMTQISPQPPQPPYVQYAPAPPPTPGRGKAIAALVLGICGLVFWLCPIVGLAVAVTGLVLGILSHRERKTGLALAGIICSGLALLATIANGGYGAYLGATGQHPFIKALSRPAAVVTPQPTTSGATGELDD